jgi:hypothetical protein
MASLAVRILKDHKLAKQIGSAAAHLVAEKFCTGSIVPRYEALYERVRTGVRAGVQT